MDEIEVFRQRYPVVPKQYISYQRAAYFGKDDSNFRLTFDRALTVILSLYRYEDQVYDK